MTELSALGPRFCQATVLLTRSCTMPHTARVLWQGQTRSSTGAPRGKHSTGSERSGIDLDAVKATVKQLATELLHRDSQLAGTSVLSQITAAHHHRANLCCPAQHLLRGMSSQLADMR